MAVETAGLLVFTFKLVLTDDGSEGLPGWRRRFLSHGTFRQFPENHAFGQLSTDQLNCGLEALAKKTLLELPLFANYDQNHPAFQPSSLQGRCFPEKTDAVT
jgi:hypothetical protein